MKSTIDQAYDISAFRANAHELVDLLADHLEKVQTKQVPTFYWSEPDDQYEDWANDLAQGIESNPNVFFQKVLDRSIQLNSPNYMGHQIAPPVLTATMAGFVSDFLNNGMGVYEMGVASSALDKVIIKAVASQMGLQETTDGVLTSGGTLGNLTALLAARKNKAKADIWNQGGNQKLALMVSEQAHYCVDRAARIMGWGSEGIIKIPVNDRYQIRTDLLEEYYLKARNAGIEVIAVVGSACSTSTGSFDDLNAIADFCEVNKLWLHVDGAHGGAFALSSKTRHLVAGIERADSIVMDFHKSLATPALSTALFFKNGALSFRTFSQQADYLFKSAAEEWYNMAKRTFECTKFMMSIKIYSIIKTHGFAFFTEYVERLLDMGNLFAQIVDKTPNFELALEPMCNIICFRWIKNGLSHEALNESNEYIRTQILNDGTYYIVKTKLKDSIWLRCTLTNPFTGKQEINGLLGQIHSIAANLEVTQS